MAKQKQQQNVYPHANLDKLANYQLKLLVEQLKVENCYLVNVPLPAEMLKYIKAQFDIFDIIKVNQTKKKVGKLWYQNQTWRIETPEVLFGDDIDILISGIMDWVEDEEEIPDDSANITTQEQVAIEKFKLLTSADPEVTKPIQNLASLINKGFAAIFPEDSNLPFYLRVNVKYDDVYETIPCLIVELFSSRTADNKPIKSIKIVPSVYWNSGTQDEDSEDYDSCDGDEPDSPPDGWDKEWQNVDLFGWNCPIKEKPSYGYWDFNQHSTSHAITAHGVVSSLVSKIIADVIWDANRSSTSVTSE
jgi:hypothetical protein